MIGRISHKIEILGTGTHYSTADLHNNEFVGRVPRSKRDLSDILLSIEFIDEGDSMRLLNEDMQLHAFLYDGCKILSGTDGCTYVYAHYEDRYDKNTIDHFLKRNKNGAEGVRRMKRLLDELGVTYEPIRP